MMNQKLVERAENFARKHNAEIIETGNTMMTPIFFSEVSDGPFKCSFRSHGMNFGEITTGFKTNKELEAFLNANEA